MKILRSSLVPLAFLIFAQTATALPVSTTETASFDGFDIFVCGNAIGQPSGATTVGSFSSSEVISELSTFSSYSILWDKLDFDGLAVANADGSGTQGLKNGALTLLGFDGSGSAGTNVLTLKWDTADIVWGTGTTGSLENFGGATVSGIFSSFNQLTYRISLALVGDWLINDPYPQPDLETPFYACGGEPTQSGDNCRFSDGTMSGKIDLSYKIEAVPEPATAVLLLSGLLGGGAMRRRSKDS